MGFDNVVVVPTGKSMTYRIKVPVIDFNGSFETYKPYLDECFKACEELFELSDIIAGFASICEEDK